ncbi:MAG: hypothetical protein KDD34_02850, partial [Bdellovibrionales bacterium]|nr:hypothetical protein [Bdellovibrionales bacterium]
QAYLSPPPYGPDDDGWAVYDESIQVLWGLSEPRHPLFIIAGNSYLGPLELPAPYGSVFMKDELKAHFPASDSFGRKFIVQLYNYFEEKSDDYNCITDSTCQVIEEDDAIQFKLPGMIIGFTKDERRALYYVAIQENIDAGKFLSPYDLVQRKSLLLDDKGSTIDEISLGLKWEAAKEKSESSNPKVQVDRNSFNKEYNGLRTFITKSHFDRDYQKPDEDEVYKGLSIFAPFNQPILVNGKKLWLELSNKGLVKVSASNQAPDKKDGVFVGAIQPTMPVLGLKPAVQAEFMTQLKNVILNEMKNFYSQNSVVYGNVRGHLENKIGRSMNLLVTGYNLSKKSGHIVYVSIQEKSGGLFFHTEMITDPFAPNAYSEVMNDVDANSRTLGGFKLGEAVQISAMDLGRDEATVQVATLGDMKERVNFEEEVSVNVVQNVDGQIRDMPETLSVISGFANVALGLRAEQSSDQDGPFTVKTITFSTQGKIKNLCNIPNLSFQYGDYDVTAQKLLIAAIEKANKIKSSIDTKKLNRQKNQMEGKPLDPKNDLTPEEELYQNYTGCQYSTSLKPDSTGLFSDISFPNQGLRLNFDLRALSSVTIYPKSWDASDIMNKGANQ